MERPIIPITTPITLRAERIITVIPRSMMDCDDSASRFEFSLTMEEAFIIMKIKRAA
jgi:hypothetical protein